MIAAVRARVRSLRSSVGWNPFVNWLTAGSHGTIAFSALRVVFAIAMLSVLLPSFADRQYLWGVGSWWMAPHADLQGWWEPLRVPFSTESAALFDLAYVALILLVLAFLVGWKTRWVAPVLLFGWVALISNNPLLPNGGDALMRITLLFAVFADLSRHFSVDSWLERRRASAGRAPRRELLPVWLRAALHNTALVLCCYQIILVYLVSSVYKLMGQEWLDGTALYYALSLTEFQVLPALSEAMWQVTPFVMVATWISFGAQLAFPVMLLWRPTRGVAVIVLTTVHLGIAIFLGLWSFSLTMIALDLLFVRDSTWRQLAGAVRHGRRRVSRLIALSQVAEQDDVAEEIGLRKAG